MCFFRRDLRRYSFEIEEYTHSLSLRLILPRDIVMASSIHDDCKYSLYPIRIWSVQNQVEWDSLHVHSELRRAYPSEYNGALFLYVFFRCCSVTWCRLYRYSLFPNARLVYRLVKYNAKPFNSHQSRLERAWRVTESNRSSNRLPGAHGNEATKELIC